MLGAVAPLNFYQGKSLKVNKRPLPLPILARRKTLGILVRPNLENSATLFRLFYSPVPEFIPYPGARVPKKNSRLRFQQPA